MGRQLPRYGWLATLLLPLALVSATNSQTQTRSRQVRHDKDFAPRLVHQPKDDQVQPNMPHTIECPVEARPLAEVSWFKDDQPLEQTGNELVFLQMTEEHSGEYRCQASNYLGKVSSARFMLTVQTSRDPQIRFEPRLAEVEPDRQVRFTCTIPGGQRRGSGGPEVSWRRNGRRLQVKWLDDEEDLAEARSRFVGQRLSSSTATTNDFVLTITKAQLKDDNATFTCLYTIPDDNQAPSSLARESDPVRLRVYELTPTAAAPSPDTNQAANNRVQMEVNLGQPIDNLANTKDPSLLPHSNHHNHNHQHNANQTTTQLIEPRRISSSLRETLGDLYEMAKPSLMILLLVLIVSAFVILQLIYLRKRTRQNRYMKHQYSGGSSGTSSALGGSSIDCGDPVLNSLMGRTLSAPSAMSLAAAGKKYRSYRDHMRKVAAANDLVGDDPTDSYFAAAAAAASGAGSQQVTSSERKPFFGPTVLPNLYNQSLAAREQHRSLLQATTNEHMRSLSNLSHQTQSVQQSLKQQALRLGGHLNGSHLNLPLSFAFNNNSTATTAIEQQAPPPLMHNGSLWPPHLAQFPAAGARNQLQQQLQLSANQQLAVSSQRQLNPQSDSEHYQLVNCSSLSPSSFSSACVESANSGAQVRLDQVDHSQEAPINHYSTIDNTEEEEDRYEELDHRSGPIKRSVSHVKTGGSQVKQQDNYTRGSHRTSTFVSGVESQQQQLDLSTHQKSSLRPSLMSSANSSSSGCGDSTMTSSSLASGDTFSRFGSKRSGRSQQQASGMHKRQTSYQDRLSPYAVSSVCSSIVQPPPPVNSEAMKALNEQFDINQLMLLDEPPTQTLAPADTQSSPLPPPPPDRPPSSTDMDRYQERRRPRQNPS